MGGQKPQPVELPGDVAGGSATDCTTSRLTDPAAVAQITCGLIFEHMKASVWSSVVMLLGIGVFQAWAVNVNYFWSADGSTQGGTGTWNTTDQRWGTSASGPFTTVWDNTTLASDIANFGGTAGTVTVDSAGINARRVNVTTSGYVLQGGKITSDQVNNAFMIDKSAANAVTINNDFDMSVTGTANIRLRNSGGLANPLTLGGTYKFLNASGTKFLDLEGTGTSGSRIDFTGALLDTPGATVRLRLGQAGTSAASDASVYNLSGNSTYAGGTHVVRGTVNVLSSTALGVGGVQLATSVTPSGATVKMFVVGAIDLPSGVSLTTANPASGTVTAIFGKDVGDSSTSTINGNVNLNVDSTSLQFHVHEAAAQVKLAGLVTDGAGTRGITKTGAGVLALNYGPGNTYDGTTTVSAGTLLVNNTSGSGTGTGAVNVSGGATLGGSGSVAGTVTTLAGNAAIAPGTSVGKLTVGNANLAAGATLKFELGPVTTPGTTYDWLAVSGLFTGSTAPNGLSFEFTDVGGLQLGVPYTLITFANASGLDYTDLNATLLPSGAALDPGFGVGGWRISDTALQVQFVPEPGTAGLVLLGVGLRLLIRRRSS
ncbi:MAG: autotransporter-associated beta strand repeat-containing protein [Verrucomicrobiae bacterium]|nr:autotransporter-associated beta strand repeat-containing protein [Verrucomicrobiae bacterium]